MAARAAPPGVRRRLERRHLRRAARLPQQLDGDPLTSRSSPAPLPRRRTVTSDFHVVLKRPTPMDVPLTAARESRRVHGRPCRRRSDDRGEREDDGDLPRDVRGRAGGAPRLSPVVERRGPAPVVNRGETVGASFVLLALGVSPPGSPASFPFWFDSASPRSARRRSFRAASRRPTAPVLVTGSSLLIFPNDVCAETV